MTMYKRISAFILTAVMLLSLTSCSGKTASDEVMRTEDTSDEVMRAEEASDEAMRAEDAAAASKEQELFDQIEELQKQLDALESKAASTTQSANPQGTETPQSAIPQEAETPQSTNPQGTETPQTIVIEEDEPMPIQQRSEIMTSADGTKTIFANTAILECDGEQYDCSVEWNTTFGGYYAVIVTLNYGEEIPIPKFDFDTMSLAYETINEICFCLPQSNISAGQVYSQDDLMSTGIGDSQYLTLNRDVPGTILDDITINTSKDYSISLAIEAYKPKDTITFSLDYLGRTAVYDSTPDGYMLLENGEPVFYNQEWSFKLFGGAYFGKDNTDPEQYAEIVGHAKDFIETLTENTTQANPFENQEPACICGGSGVCNVCRGAGSVSHYGHSSVCSNCGGTGRCLYH